MAIFPITKPQRHWGMAFVVLAMAAGCDLTCPIEPESPIVSPESVEAQKARADDEAFRKVRRQQEAKSRTRGKFRKMPVEG